MGQKAAFDEIVSTWHFNELWDKSGVGIAILDEQLRYQSLNRTLAHMHGISSEMHIGRHLKEVIGELAAQVEPALKRVLDTGRPVLNFEAAGILPRRPARHRWFCSYFPVKNALNQVKQVGAIVVDLGPDAKPGSTQPGDGQRVEGLASTEILRSWKDIASHTGTCVKTAQRWERSYGLPVRRLAASKGAVVFALRAELDGWMRARTDRAKSAICDERMKAIFTYSPVPALVIDDNRVIVHANIRALDLYRATQDQLVGKKLGTLAFGGTPDQEDYEWDLFQKTGVTAGTRNLRRADGTVFSAEYIMKKVATDTHLITFTAVGTEAARREAMFVDQTSADGGESTAIWRDGPLISPHS
jgi:PAS domain S-box-containing protein